MEIKNKEIQELYNLSEEALIDKIETIKNDYKAIFASTKSLHNGKYTIFSKELSASPLLLECCKEFFKHMYALILKRIENVEEDSKGHIFMCYEDSYSSQYGPQKVKKFCRIEKKLYINAIFNCFISIISYPNQNAEKLFMLSTGRDCPIQHLNITHSQVRYAVDEIIYYTKLTNTGERSTNVTNSYNTSNVFVTSASSTHPIALQYPMVCLDPIGKGIYNRTVNYITDPNKFRALTSEEADSIIRPILDETRKS
jgi:hypothetical protein